MFSTPEETVDLRDWVESDTEPTDTAPGLKWLDTSSDPHVWRRRNDTDDGWIVVGAAGGGHGFDPDEPLAYFTMSDPDGVSWTVTIDTDGNLVTASFTALLTETGDRLTTEDGDVLTMEDS
jgi:hypothetical protein